MEVQLNASAVNAITGVRWYSQENEWMDCVVLAPTEYESAVINAISAGVDAFFEDENQQPYGDCIEYALYQAGIPHLLELLDEEAEAESPYWEEHFNDLRYMGANIHTVTS